MLGRGKDRAVCHVVHLSSVLFVKDENNDVGDSVGLDTILQPNMAAGGAEAEPTGYK
jgi:hypothetical protein